jgi:hypothetical protein
MTQIISRMSSLSQIIPPYQIISQEDGKLGLPWKRVTPMVIGTVLKSSQYMWLVTPMLISQIVAGAEGAKRCAAAVKKDGQCKCFLFCREKGCSQ